MFSNASDYIYARGLSVSEIQAHCRKCTAPPSLISAITDALRKGQKLAPLPDAWLSAA
ncbi:hypothetical protein ABH912_005485 [Pseudomonas sp. BT76 TE3572]